MPWYGELSRWRRPSLDVNALKLTISLSVPCGVQTEIVPFLASVVYKFHHSNPAKLFAVTTSLSNGTLQCTCCMDLKKGSLY